MKSIKNKFSTVVEFKSLLDAYNRIKNKPASKTGTLFFSEVLSASIVDLASSLTAKSFKVGAYQSFYIKTPKKRKIMCLSLRTNILLDSLMHNALIPFYTKRLDYDAAACVKGKGLTFALKRTSGFLRTAYHKWGEFYVLKCDIKQFYASINHSVLLAALNKNVSDQNLMQLLTKIVRSTSGNVGLPVGVPTSNLFAQIYLMGMDTFIRHSLKIPFYSRYMDDFILIHKSKQYLTDCKNQLTELLGKIGLTLNHKTAITPIKSGFNYLGFRFILTKNGGVRRLICGKNLIRTRRVFKSLERKYNAGNITFDHAKSTINGWLAHAKKGHTYSLRTSILADLKFSCSRPKTSPPSFDTIYARKYKSLLTQMKK